MKKSIKLLTLSLLATGMLVGCGSDPVAPDWSAADKEAMRSVLHGEVLPFITGVEDLEVVPGSTFVGVLGGEVSPETLASYSELYLAAGWDFLGSYKDPTTGVALSYNFEKEITTEEGVRYASAQFGGINSSYQFVENGDFMLYASDPYVYSWEDAALDVELFVLNNFLSEEELPAPVECQHYEVGDNEDYGETDLFMMVKCYTDDDEAADKYYATLSETTGEHKWHVYAGQEDTEDGVFFYMADSPDGKYGIQYFYSEEQGCLVLYIAEANFLYEFPQAQLNALLTALEATGSVPALAGDRYRYLADYSAAIVYFDATPAEPDCGYTDILESTGWNARGYVESVGEYVADTADGKASIRYYFEANEEEPGGMFIIEVTEPAFVSEMPADVAKFVSSVFYYGIVEGDMIPDVAGATQYIFNSDNARLGIYYASEEADGGYGALLEAAGFTVSAYTEVENGRTIHYAFSPLFDFYGFYYFNYGIRYSYKDGVLAIEFDYVDNFSYKTADWSSAFIKEMFDINGYTYFEVPAFASTEAERSFDTSYYYNEDAEMMFVDVVASNVSAMEIITYFNGLYNSEEWSVMEGSSANAGGASKEFSELKGTGYIYWSTMIEENPEDPSNPIFHFAVLIAMDMGPIGLPEFPTEAAELFIASLGKTEDEVKVGELVAADPEAYFVVDDSDPEVYTVYAYGATVEEQAAYVEELESLGWTIVSEPSEKYPYDATLKYGDTGLTALVEDWTAPELGGYVKVEFYYVRPPEPEFPLDEINSFLNGYELGFSFTAEDAWEDPSGKGYSISYDNDGTYDIMMISISGNYVEEVLAIIDPIITAETAGYECYDSTEGQAYYYYNGDYHEVWVYYNGGNTTVLFYE